VIVFSVEDGDRVAESIRTGSTFEPLPFSSTPMSRGINVSSIPASVSARFVPPNPPRETPTSIAGSSSRYIAPP
jgi:hypothetical protein